MPTKGLRTSAEALIKQAAEDHEKLELLERLQRLELDFVQIVMGLLHRYRGLKVWVVYRVPDDLNDLNGLNCLNEQRLLPSGLEV